MSPTTQFPLLFCIAMSLALIVPRATCIESENVARYETTVFLRCQDGKAVAGARSSVLNYQWILPSGKILKTERTISNSTKHILLRDGFILQIQNVEKSDYGLYVCLIFSNQTDSEIINNVRHELNKNIWYEKTNDYPVKIQYGFLAGFVVLVVTAMICYNYDQHQECLDNIGKEQQGNSYEMKQYPSNGQEAPVILVTPAEQYQENQGFQKDESNPESAETDMKL